MGGKKNLETKILRLEIHNSHINVFTKVHNKQLSSLFIFKVQNTAEKQFILGIL